MENDSLHDYLAILKRRRLPYFLTALGALILVLVGVFTFSSYRAEATIQVQSPDIPQVMTTPLGVTASEMIQALADQRIEMINQKVTSAASLADIITKFDLYPSARRTQPLTEVIEKMRKKIKLELVSSDLANPAATQRLQPGQLAAIAFTVSFTYKDPLTAQHVANEIVSRILDEDLKQRRTQAKVTSDFLQTQIERLEQTLSEQEKKIADFKSQHPYVRPETIQLNQQQLELIRMDMQQLDAQLSSLAKTRGDLRAQLAGVEPYSRVVADGQLVTTAAIQLKALQARYSTLSAQYGSDHPDVLKLRHQIEALQGEVGQSPDTADIQTRINDTRTNLAAAKNTYGDRHPDVLALQSQLAGLEDQYARQAHDPTAHDEIKKDADNPAYLMLVSQIHGVDDQIGGLTAQKEALRRQVEKLETYVSVTPAVEQELATLSRDYDNAQLRYRELKEKKLSADISEQEEQGRIAERLVVIDPPQLPTDTHPQRLILLAGGVLLAALSGFGAVVLAEMLSLTVHGPRQMMKLTGMMPLVVVPHIFTREERRRIRRMRLRAGVAAAVVVVGGIVLFDQMVMPLDVLWGIVTNRFGLS